MDRMNSNSYDHFHYYQTYQGDGQHTFQPEAGQTSGGGEYHRERGDFVTVQCPTGCPEFQLSIVYTALAQVGLGTLTAIPPAKRIGEYHRERGAFVTVQCPTGSPEFRLSRVYTALTRVGLGILTAIPPVKRIGEYHRERGAFVTAQCPTGCP
ncbi:MAG: hypothetical protein P8X89_23450 [Reinekea sp.]